MYVSTCLTIFVNSLICINIICLYPEQIYREYMYTYIYTYICTHTHMFVHTAFTNIDYA